MSHGLHHHSRRRRPTPSRTTIVGMIGVVLAVSLALSACRHRPSMGSVVDRVADIEPLPLEDASAEVLYAEVALIQSAREDFYIQRHVHEVRRINHENGLGYANVRFWVGDHEELVGFRATTVQPDGTRIELDEDRLYAFENDDGDVMYSFRFPKARVGSVLEFVYTRENNRGYTHGATFDISRRVPVRRFRLDIRGTTDIAGELKVYGIDSDVVRRTREGDMWRLQVALDDVLPFEREPFGPSRNRGEVWAMYRNKKIGPYKGRRTWASVMKSHTKALYVENTWLEGFRDTFHRSECDDLSRSKCIERIKESVDEDLILDDYSLGEPRPMDDVLAAGRASSRELATLMWHRLDRAGIEAHYAYTRRDREGRFDEDMPTFRWFDHMILYIPEQEGLETAVWVDPSCASCAPGELYDTLLENRAVSVRNEGEKYYAALRPVKARPMARSERLRHVRLELDEDGDARIEERHVLTGTLGESVARGNILQTESTPEEDQTKRIQRIYPEASEIEVKVENDRNAGKVERTIRYRLPDYAVADGEDLIVPLRVLDGTYGSTIESRERRQNIIVGREQRTQTLEIVVPEGWKIGFAPEPRRHTITDKVRSEVTVTLSEDRRAATLSWTLEFVPAELTTAAWPLFREALLVKDVLERTGVVAHGPPPPPPEPVPVPESAPADSAPSSSSQSAL